MARTTRMTRLTSFRTTPARRSRGIQEPTYIYNYRPRKDAEVQGYQVRFKRLVAQGKDVTEETESQYFAFSHYPSKSATKLAAERWRDRNKRWMRDRKFKVSRPKWVSRRMAV